MANPILSAPHGLHFQLPDPSSPFSSAVKIISCTIKIPIETSSQAGKFSEGLFHKESESSLGRHTQQQ